MSFAIPGSGVRTIRPLSDLPLLSGPVVLDASTQPGFAGVPLVEIDGSLVTSGNQIGLWINGGASTIRGLVVNRWANRAILVESSGNTVVGNYLGTTVDGSAKAADFSFGAFEIRIGADITSWAALRRRTAT